jgi:hypothetical protein
MTDASTWFIAIVGSGTVNALVAYFIQRFVVKPVDRKVAELSEVIKAFNKSTKELIRAKKKILNKEEKHE